MIHINFLAASRIQAAIECLPRTAAEDHSDRYLAGKGEIEMSTFTPGPWRWSDAYPARDLSDTYSLIGADGFGILSCDGLCNSPQHLNKADAALIADAPAMLDALEKAVDHIERNTCQHEDTYRGGAIWEICRECGAKWADDDGGKPEFKWPEYVEQACAIIAKHRGRE
jgi:hypothetical protein